MEQKCNGCKYHNVEYIHGEIVQYCTQWVCIKNVSCDKQEENK